MKTSKKKVELKVAEEVVSNHTRNPFIDQSMNSVNPWGSQTAALDYRVIVPEEISVHNMAFAHVKSQERLLELYNLFAGQQIVHNQAHKDWIVKMIYSLQRTDDDRFNPWQDDDEYLKLINMNATNLAELGSERFRRMYPYFKWSKNILFFPKFIPGDGPGFTRTELLVDNEFSEVLRLATDGLISWASLCNDAVPRFKIWLNNLHIQEMDMVKADRSVPEIHTGLKLYTANSPWYNEEYHNLQ